MKLPKSFSQQVLLFILTASLIGFVLLSWWLLFRDERAIAGFEAINLNWNGQLFQIRELLLNYSLNVLPTILFAFFTILSFGAYFFLLQKKIALKTVLFWSVTFQICVFFAYPILSTDIYSYIFSDRVSSVYKENTWKVVPATFTEDNFYSFADWKMQTNAYGYVHHLVYAPAVYLGSENFFLTMVLYKCTAFVFTLASIFALLFLLSNRTEQEKSYYVRLLFWNPLLLLEFVGTAHNDSVMAFFLLLGMAFWMKKSWFLAGTFIACAIQVKLLPIIYFGFLFVYLLQRRNIQGLFKFVGSFLLVTSSSFVLMQVSPVQFLERVFYNATSYWQSLPALLSRFAPTVTLPYTVLFGLSGLLLLFLQVKNKWNPIGTGMVAFLLYFTFFTGSYWNWYVLWIFVLLPLIKSEHFKNAILLMTFVSLFAYPLLWFSYRFGFGHPIWPIATYVWIFGVPIGYLGYNYGRAHRKNLL